MNIEKVSKEFATDWVKLVNDLKDIKFDSHVSYKTKSGTKEFDYVSLDKLYRIIKENDNFAITEPLGTDNMGQSALQVLVIHKSGEHLISGYYPLRIPAGADKQDEGSAITYTKRYALGSFLGISTDVDTDGPTPREDSTPEKTRTIPKAPIKSLATDSQLQIIATTFSEEEITKALELVKKKDLKELTVVEASQLISSKNKGDK